MAGSNAILARRRFDVLSLEGLPAPAVIETIDYEALLAAGRQKFSELWNALRALNPQLPEYDSIMIESDALLIWMEVLAAREQLLRSRVNEAAKAVMVRSSTGADLDNLAALFPVARQAGESDARFRERIMLAPEAYAAGGPFDAYRFFAMKAAPTIKHVAVFKSGEGSTEKIIVVPLDAAGDGTPSAETLEAIRVALDPETIIPATAVVEVRAPTITTYDVVADLLIPHGADAATVRQAAEDALRTYAASRHKVGFDVYRNGLIAALKVSPVEDVTLYEPAATLEQEDGSAAFLGTVTINIEKVA